MWSIASPAAIDRGGWVWVCSVHMGVCAWVCVEEWDQLILPHESVKKWGQLALM